MKFRSAMVFVWLELEIDAPGERVVTTSAASYFLGEWAYEYDNICNKLSIKWFGYY